ncbi:hypothetical protein S40288_09635 [Stachybotrys chartarum IBT 40288]|nr:hypothetical protein S40288_09635 [Stachybotrys chartarum IBT 40288]
MASPRTSVSDAMIGREPESNSESDSESGGTRSPTTKAIDKLNIRFIRFKSTLSTFQSSQPIANPAQASLQNADNNSMAALADATDSLRRHVSYVKRLLRASPTSAPGKTQQEDTNGDAVEEAGDADDDVDEDVEDMEDVEGVEDMEDIEYVEYAEDADDAEDIEYVEHIEDAEDVEDAEDIEDTGLEVVEENEDTGDEDPAPALGKRRRDDGAGDQEAGDEDEPPGDGNGRADGDVPQDAAEPGQLSREEKRSAKRARRAGRRSARESALRKDRHGFKIASLYDADDLPMPLLKLLIRIHSPHSLVAALDLVGDSGAPIAVPNRQAVHFPMISAITNDQAADVKRVADIIRALHEESMGRNLLRRPLYFDAWFLSRGHNPRLSNDVVQATARQLDLRADDIRKDIAEGEKMYKGLGGHKGLIPFLKLRCDEPDSFGGLSNVSAKQCEQLGELLDDVRARKLCRIGQLILRRAVSTEPEPLALRQIMAKRGDFGEAGSLEEFDELLGEYGGCDCEGTGSTIAEH